MISEGLLIKLCQCVSDSITNCDPITTEIIYIH